MYKKIIIFLILFPFSLLLAACGTGGEISATEKQDTEPDNQSSVANEASDISEKSSAAVKDNSTENKDVSDISENPSAAENSSAAEGEIKSLNFIYKEENLTYDLVWSDEFDYEGRPDWKKWSCELGGHGWGNNELQYYTNNDNVTVADGKMIIEARKEEMGGRDVTSTRIVTAGKGDWLYGKFDICAKVPKGLGSWPAIWMLPTQSGYGSWPDIGEIDIMEHVGLDEDVIVTTVHTAAYNHSIGTQKGESRKYPGITDDFHVYGIEWLPDKIKFSIDGEVQFVYDPSQYGTDEITYREWPFDKPFHLIINLAFGGDWGGMNGVDYDILPLTYEIDYVRVYQSPEINALAAEQP